MEIYPTTLFMNDTQPKIPSAFGYPNTFTLPFKLFHKILLPAYTSTINSPSPLATITQSYFDVIFPVD